MMKWLAVIGALALTLAASIGVWYYLRDSAEQLCRELEKVEQAVQREDWQEAERALDGVEQEWARLQRRWAMLIDHKEMEDIEISLVDLKSAVRGRQRQEALKEGAELAFFLRHTPDAERPGWDNIF